MNKFKHFVNTTIVYFVGNVLSKLVIFFLLPLYTSKISPYQYGTYDMMLAFINLIVPILFFQIWDGMFRSCFDYDNENDKYKIISNAHAISAISIVTYSVLFLLLHLIFKIDYALYVYMYGLVFSLHYLFGYICRSFLANKLYAFSGLLNTVITATLNVVLIVKFNWDIKSLYLAPVVGMILQMLVIECKFRTFKHFSLKDIERDISLKMIRFSIPLCLSSISYWLLSGFTKVLITSVLGASENGLFAVANKFSTTVVMITTMFQYAWNESAYLMSNDKNRADTYSICIGLLFKFAILGSSAICILIKIIFPYLIHSQYVSAIDIIPATIIGSMMNSMAGFVATLFMTERKTKEVMYSTVISSVINVILGLICTKVFGIHGATISLAIAFANLMIIRLIQAKKQLNIKIDLKEIFTILCVLAFSTVEYYLIKNIFIDIFAVIIIICVFLMIMKKYIVLIKDR